MMINIQPMLDESKQSRGDPLMSCPELKKLFREHGDDAQMALAEHYRNVALGLTDEYKQMGES